MTPLERRLDRLLRRRLALAGLDSSQFLSAAQENVVFGSRAIEVDSRRSDLDVLVVGKFERLKEHGLDLIPIAPESLGSPKWLGSELASHVANYGVWLRGPGSWRRYARLETSAIANKERRIRALLAAVSLSWTAIHSSFQLRYALTIRRELRRLALMKQELPVPPTPLLDECEESRHEVFDAIGRLGLSTEVPPALLAAVCRLSRTTCMAHSEEFASSICGGRSSRG
jgi:hypothetical protein